MAPGSRSWPAAGGEMGGRIRAFDWSATSLGPIGGWAEGLKAAIGLMLESGQLASMVVGPDRLFFYNDQAALHYGARHPGVLGQRIEDGFAGEYSLVAPIYDRVFAGESVHVPAQPLDPAGRGTPEIFDAYLTPVRDGGGKVIAAHMTGFAVGDRLRAEAAQREGKERFQALVSAGAYSIYRMSPDWRIMYALDSDTLAVTNEPIVDWVDKYIPQEDRPEILAAIGQAIAGKSPFDMEHRVWFEDGSIGWVRSRAVPILGPDDEIVEWFGTGSNITDRKQSEEALRASEELRRVALEGGRMGTWRWDLSEGLIYGDAAFQGFWGFPATDESRPLHFYTDRMTASGQTEVAEVVARAIAANEEFDGKLEVADGPAKGGWVRWRGRAEHGRQRFLYGVSFDVTELHLAEAAEQSRREREAFLLRLSDKLRPLADAATTQSTAMNEVAAYFGVEMAGYVEVGPDGDLGTFGVGHQSSRIPFASEIRVSDFGVAAEHLRAGRTYVYEDAETDPRLGAHRDAYLALNVRSGVAVPLMKAGKLAIILAVNQTKPRQWRAVELRLLEEIAERTWAAVERARAEAALRESEERLRRREADLARVQRIGGIGGIDIEVVPGLRSRRSPEYIRLHGLPADTQEEDHEDWLARVHPDDRQAAGQSLFAALESVVPSYELEYRIIRPSDGAVRWIAARADIERDATGKALRLVGAHIDITEQKRVQEALSETEERLSQFGEASQDLLWIRDAETLQWVYLTPAFETIYGLSREEALIGDNYRNWQDLIVPEDREHAVASIEKVRGGDHVNFQFRVRRPADGEIRWLRNTDFPIRDASGRVVLIGGIGHDLTTLKRAEERQATLLAELQHRVRNILAVTRSIISRSDNGERSTEDYVQHLQGRISALARTQVLLTRKAGAAIDLENLIRDELLAQVASDDQFALQGPDVALSAKAAEVLTLAVHELATNATKYGAFSRDSGRVTVQWRTEARAEHRWLVLDWAERGVPILDAAPRRHGFGTELISQRIPYELKGFGQFELRPGGLHSRIEFPLIAGESVLQTTGALP